MARATKPAPFCAPFDATAFGCITNARKTAGRPRHATGGSHAPGRHTSCCWATTPGQPANTIATHRAVAAAAPEPVGVQGHIDWDPALPVTPLMRFLAPAGPQFYFTGLAANARIPFTAVLGSNFSAPTSWFRDQPFDEGFPDASFEDTELAFRWSQRGWHAVYAPQAICWHRHHYGHLEPFLERQRRAGRSARHATRLLPKLLWRTVAQPTLIGGSLQTARLLARRLTGRSTRNAIWDLRCRLAFLRGFLGSSA